MTRRVFGRDDGLEPVEDANLFQLLADDMPLTTAGNRHGNLTAKMLGNLDDFMNWS